MPKRVRDSESEEEEEEDQDFKPTNTKEEESDEEEDYESTEEEPKKQSSVKKTKTEEVSEGERNENGEEYFILSGKRRITIRSFQGKKCVDLREYYQAKDGEQKPSSKGLLLPLEQFKRFVELIPQIDSAIERL
ncbi:transcriptional Coactivator p15-domain-containing protein [Halteromyces radiatus]|uniref:transcriptional Coactivator p15-domain-containing protein n=1 Tax=Halteromyces radiatus TaxID=101107 RepID=UPI002220B8C7|nr:transcriptional Coactivator p15-domain-containing protein [Halteromyces radiatus]KAI8089659.1 transcriptional Coactivator p15-domain-containing protein [Halteromyces radiatus]